MRDVVVVYHITIVVTGHGLLKKFWPLVLGCVLRTAGSSIIWNYAGLLTLLELLNYFLTLASSFKSIISFLVRLFIPQVGHCIRPINQFRASFQSLCHVQFGQMVQNSVVSVILANCPNLGNKWLINCQGFTGYTVTFGLFGWFCRIL